MWPLLTLTNMSCQIVVNGFENNECWGFRFKFIWKNYKLSRDLSLHWQICHAKEWSMVLRIMNVGALDSSSFERIINFHVTSPYTDKYVHWQKNLHPPPCPWYLAVKIQPLINGWFIISLKQNYVYFKKLSILWCNLSEKQRNSIFITLLNLQ